MDPGGLLKKSKKVNKRGCMQRLMIERSSPLSTDFLAKTSDERLSRISFIVLYFVADSSFTADGGLL